MQLVYLDKLTVPIECDDGGVFIESKNHRFHHDAEDRVWLIKAPNHHLCLHVSYRKQHQPPIKIVRVEKIPERKLHRV